MADAGHPRKSEWTYYESAGGWKTAFATEKGERTSAEDEAERTASGDRIETGEAMFAVRQRYRGQSGVEHVFVFRVFSLLHASQHALACAPVAGEETNEERPVNMNSTTIRSKRLTAFMYGDCIDTLYNGKEKKQ